MIDICDVCHFSRDESELLSTYEPVPESDPMHKTLLEMGLPPYSMRSVCAKCREPRPS